ncbi:SgcJ/EcaC family oxidoreductase [Actinokineospora enzanensis]|uniref:SgcJ/EcaC family oxidoreductase n=1 Tax=Actinokineospora enzanensis TaxID=155975 RepID=UPI0003609738|nr:SgcJ/EcaC family oxidoreductase [Actinokineospora enzanensis]
MTVDEVINELVRVWNAGDSAGWAACFAEDAVFVDVLGRVQRGRTVIAREHRKIFDTIYRGSRLEIRAESSRPLADGLLLVHSTSTLRVPDGPRAGETRAVQTMLLADGLVLAFQNTIRSAVSGFAKGDEELGRLDPLGWGA